MTEPQVVARSPEDVVAGPCPACEEEEWHIHVYHQSMGNLIAVTPVNGAGLERYRWPEDVLPWYKLLFTMKAHRTVWPKTEEELVESIALCRAWIREHHDDPEFTPAAETVERVIGA